MTEIRDIEVVVFDVLGTLVDEPDGIAAAIREALPEAEPIAVDELVALWQRHVEDEQARIARGEREYANTEVIDAEAAWAVAERAGIDDPADIARLATAGQRLAPWEDSVAGIERLSWHFPTIGLSNASRAALLRLNAFAGLRFHQALSTEWAGAYKPAPEVYRLALDAAACEPERVLMVAAHAWDLRGAQAVGMRTAYIGRSVGDPPKDTDTFDGHFDGLAALTAAIVPQ
ncbi:haloacid dehalogenase type II [Glycomyces luteolus]|uniref:Haloacid dehalogenase type II n=1 Tax=Glycomyces luteolus TaxID=2670330 RepID=A0A9X3T4K6_9ACTN|nr:haloacid dehalogenase type II [Glycomyces luteolus]MDA1361210.1 haloacid dehalogenase type II [Glycomyces luteolus]